MISALSGFRSAQHVASKSKQIRYLKLAMVTDYFDRLQKIPLKKYETFINTFEKYYSFEFKIFVFKGIL